MHGDCLGCVIGKDCAFAWNEVVECICRIEKTLSYLKEAGAKDPKIFTADEDAEYREEEEFPARELQCK